MEILNYDNEQMKYFYRDEINIETTNYCNIKCRFCSNPSLRYPRGMMSYELFKKTIDEIVEHPKIDAIHLVGIGETFLNPHIFKMIDYAHEKGVEIYSCSNGKWTAKEETLMSVLKLNHIHVTIDGVTNEVYNQSRPNTDVKFIIKSLKKIIDLKNKVNSKTPHIEVKMVVFTFNKHQVIDIVKLAIDIGADSVWLSKGAAPPHLQTDFSVDELKYLKTSFPNFTIITSGFSSSEFPIESFKRNKWKFENYGSKKCLLDEMGCAGLTVRWDGSMSACCFDFNVTSTLGNIANDSLMKLWSKDNVKKFENNLLSNHHKRVALNQTINCDRCPRFITHLERSNETINTLNSFNMNIDYSLINIQNQISNNNLKEATFQCNEILQRNPDNAYALYFLGLIEAKQANMKTAVLLMTKAVSIISSQSSVFHNNLGLILKDIGESGSSEFILNESLKLKQYAEQFK